MPDRPDSFGFIYLDADIPAGMTIREWRASRPTARGRRRWFRAHRQRVLGRAIGSGRAAVRALARPKVARGRVPGRRD